MSKNTKLVNIPRRVTDTFYRYKMPEIVAKVESRGNGIKTVVVNIADIGKALNRPPNYIVKYFAMSLGSQLIKDSEERYIIKGQIAAAKLADLLDEYIDKYVMCKSCHNNPETEMTVGKSTVTLKCVSCGYVSQISQQDKLFTYMTKNPVTMKSSTKGDKKEGVKVVKKKTIVKKVKKVKEVTEEAPQDETKTTDYNWSVDISEDAEMKRKAEMMKNAVLLRKLMDPEAEKLMIEYVKNEFISIPIEKDKVDSLVENLKKKRDELLFNEAQMLNIMCNTIIDKDIRKKIISLTPILAKFVDESTEMVLLGVIGEKATECCIEAEIASVLQYLFGKEIIRDETIVQWYNNLENETLKKDLKEFIEWLTDEEDEDDDEEVDDS